MKPELSLNALLEQLGSPASRQRRAAARELRRLALPAAGPALRAALQSEVNDRRTWETQYQMVMALAACGPCQESLKLIESLFALDLEPAVHFAACDAVLRLSDDVDDAVLAALRSGSAFRFEGALRAIAMKRLQPRPETIRVLLDACSAPESSPQRFWAVAACAGWPAELVDEFLRSCLNDGFSETRVAAEASLRREYRTCPAEPSVFAVAARRACRA